MNTIGLGHASPIFSMARGPNTAKAKEIMYNRKMGTYAGFFFGVLSLSLVIVISLG